MNHIEGQNRNQMLMISLEQMVHEEALVRIVDVFVDSLDLNAFGFVNSSLNVEGRPPFHPAVLMKLYLYGYQNGIRSCRKLEHAAQVKTRLKLVQLLADESVKS